MEKNIRNTDVPNCPPSAVPQGSAGASPPRKAVVVHAGARDSYQLALALQENGLLEALVTDLFWPDNLGGIERLIARIAPRMVRLLKLRSRAGLSFQHVHLCLLSGLRSLAFEKMPHIPFDWRRRATREADAALGRTAGTLARRRHAGLVSYSYTGFDSMRAYQRPALLFQVHPHPATVRRILLAELEAHPKCASSLRQEWELALPEDDFQRLVEETTMASAYLAASSFTRQSLVEHGVREEAITVVPYGIDLEKFRPAPQLRRRSATTLELLFVGRINQRKGLSYLLEALRLLKTKNIRLTICGRVVDDLSLFQAFRDQVEIRPSVSSEELVMAYQSADLFVFPSVAEGFGQVLLEALASGLPILSTTHTAAPDLITDGVEGFIIEPRRADLIAERLAWALANPDMLLEMGLAARRRAELYPWETFRRRASGAVRNYLDIYE